MKITVEPVRKELYLAKVIYPDGVYYCYGINADDAIGGLVRARWNLFLSQEVEVINNGKTKVE
ncbi:hypothetical protein VF04_04165 [Nostoc linckia z7]|uniref:Uncharacterized protein n=2 Tax=Nostoc linckia TaxID=92942 RepID=A0A9Q5ZGF3_NOSLI|nr:hypothetical protein [Nostoc linckia]PHK42908.1 hypothetical protein VF12_00865 [Nostoc linckia z15]PHK48065.1 hypothetical protein VF13_01840 [Nostoc linckia z16]PHJ64985.1 hypothetical protein VF02_11650 [Nostoc linckia z1]PHJ70163.1 hypothetical protein VF05_11810 [Nostoc linckia z3]PHJ75064.1 hypothetical protein VF03_11970 [Nostoc linckia z2]